MSDHVELYVDQAGEHRWHRVASNGNVISESGEGYVRLIDAREMAEKVNPGVAIIEVAESQ